MTMLIKMDGQTFISILTSRMADENILCYDNNIVQEIRELSDSDMFKIMEDAKDRKWEEDTAQDYYCVKCQALFEQECICKD